MLDYSVVMEWGDTTMIAQGETIEGFVDDIKPGPEVPMPCWADEQSAEAIWRGHKAFLGEKVRGNG